MAEVRVADYFPRVLPACREAAGPFFTCFADRSVQPAGGVRVGRRARGGRAESGGREGLEGCGTAGRACGGRDGELMWQDALAGVRALQDCAKFMESYDRCMREQLPLTKKRELYRVPEAYRTGSNAA